MHDGPGGGTDHISVVNDVLGPPEYPSSSKDSKNVESI